MIVPEGAVDVRWLETFTVAAREGSFGAAAAELGYVRSTVTHHIQKLEQAVGAKLFDRALAGQPLTISGLAMLEHAEAVLTQVDLARLKIAQIVGTEPRALKLVTTASTAAYRLAVFLRTLQRHLPTTKIHVEVAPTAEVINDKLRRGQCDVALWSTTPTDSDSQHGWRHLWEESPVMVGVAGSNDPPQKVLVTERGCVYRDIIESEFLRTSPATEIIQIGSIEAVKSGVLSRLGAGLIPLVAASPWLDGGQLVRLRWQPSRRVVTEVQWNREVCPAAVMEYLERLTGPRANAAIEAETAPTA
ncbi:MAG: LysR family transcriptional regulator [Pseudonocardiaceae bacterium]